MRRFFDFRIIPRLDVKNGRVIKGIHLEGLRQVGDPRRLVESYYNDGADEILFMDPVASLYGRNHLFKEVAQAAEMAFIPMTIGGGLRSISDVRQALDSGADKVAINTELHKRPTFVQEIALAFGSQCCVCSIEAKKIDKNRWEAYTDNGREPTGRSVEEWIKRVVGMGAGELLITSIDHEGTKKGFDLQLYELARESCTVPIIASGGAGSMEHLRQIRRQGCVSGVAIASILHYNLLSIGRIKEEIS